MGGVPILPVYTTALGYWSVLYIEASHFFTHMGKNFIFSSTLKAQNGASNKWLYDVHSIGFDWPVQSI